VTATVPAATSGEPIQRSHPFRNTMIKSALLTSHCRSFVRPDAPLQTNRFGLLSIAAAAFCSVSAAAGEVYTLTQINPPVAATSSSVDALNYSGQVVGNTFVKSGRSDQPGPAFLWTGGSAVTLPALPGQTAAEAHGISDSGVAVGQSPRQNVYATFPKAVWWGQTGIGGYTVGDWNALLPAGSSLRLISAVAISADAQFVLFDQVDTVTGRDQAVVARVNYSGNQPVSISQTWLINSLDGSVSNDGFVSAGVGISHDGNGVVRVTGYAQHQSATARAFLWEANVVTDTVVLTDLDPSGIGFSEGASVNNTGAVALNRPQAWFRNSVGAEQQVPTLGGARSVGNGLNDAGSVVGWSQRTGKNAANHAFIWSAATGISDLNSLKSTTDTSGIELTSASDITDSRRILAKGLKKGVAVNVLLKPN
jgi:probable HAF family extracellular repeat protein